MPDHMFDLLPDLLPGLLASLTHGSPLLVAGLDTGLLRLVGVVAAAWAGLIAAWFTAAACAHRARTHARDLRLDEGRMNLIDVIDLMRDTADGHGTPYWPQRSLLRDRLLTDDVPLLAAWIRSGQPLPLLVTFKHAGYTGDQISRHLSGTARLDVATARMLAALRQPTTTPSTPAG